MVHFNEVVEVLNFGRGCSIVATPKRIFHLAALLGSSMIAVASAHAQTTAGASPTVAQAETGDGQLEDIVVTATKRAAGQRAQSEPIALTAISAQGLTDRAAMDITDVGALVPGFRSVESGAAPGFPTFTIRGLGLNSTTRSNDPAVVVVQDGVVLGYPIGAVVETFDLEGVEVLRGPQGVLFGRNTTGGAVVLTTAAPGDKLAVRGQLTVGSFNRFEASASIEGGLVPDVLNAKIAVLYKRADGYLRDRNGGTFVSAAFNPTGTQPSNPAVDQPKEDTLVIKPTILVKASDTLKLTFYGQYLRSRNGGAAALAVVPPDGTTSVVQSLFGYTPPSEKFELNSNIVAKADLDTHHIIGQIDWEAMGGVVTSISAYRKVRFDSDLDQDATPFTLVHFPSNRESSEQYSEEIRYATSLSNVDLTTGFFAFSEKRDVLERREVSSLVLGRASYLPLVDIQGRFKQRSTIAAAFASLDYRVNSRLTLTAGGRFTYEKKKVDVAILRPCAGANFTGCATDSVPLARSWRSFTPRLAVDYKLAPTILVYGSWTRGSRSGVYNSRGSSIAAVGPANPEKVDSFEVGWKSDLLDRRLRLNVAAYYSLYDDVQRDSLISVNGLPVQTLTNAAKATIWGIEGELTALIGPNLTVEANAAVTKASYDQFNGLDFDRNNVVTPAELARAKELKFERVPEVTANAAATYRFDVGDLPGKFGLRGSASYSDGYFSDVVNTPNLAQKSGFTIFDASLTYTTNSWRFSLFGRNLTNKEVTTAASNFLIVQRFVNLPRTWGLTAAVNF